MQRANVFGRNRTAMISLAKAEGVQVVRQTLRELDDGRYRVQAFGEEAALDRLAASGFDVDRVEDEPFQRPVVAGGGPGPRRGRSPDGGPVGRGPAAPPTPSGPGSAPDGYLSVSDVEDRIDEISGKYSRVVSVIDLPHRTWEGRKCRALRIGRGKEDGPAIVLLGGMHAREWGSPDILIAFAERLLAGWSAKKGIAIGRRRFPADSVRQLVDDVTIYLVPQVNPDGRHHSFTVDPMWRKNRRPAPPERHDDETCVGVDINRNFDFLWDFTTAFSPDAGVSCSTSPCDPEIYVGPTAHSEPETRNVVWLLDQHPSISFLVDIHSYGELILYSWGDDENQVTDPKMTFANAAWNKKRGVFGDGYREYLRDGDRQLLVRLATAMQAGAVASRGRRYKVQQSANLYPTAGTSDDYSYSRHLVNAAHSKVLAFTVEWGAEDNPTPFHPPYAEMKKVIAEVTSGLLAFCGEAVRVNAAMSKQKDK